LRRVRYRKRSGDAPHDQQFNRSKAIGFGQSRELNRIAGINRLPTLKCPVFPRNPAKNSSSENSAKYAARDQAQRQNRMACG